MTNTNEIKMVSKDNSKDVRITWTPALVRVDENDPSKGRMASETQLEIVAKAASKNATYGKRTRYSGDIETVNEIVSRYAKRGYKVA